MKCISSIAFACALSVVATAMGPEREIRGQTIPLYEIWAWKMPRTRNAGELDAVKRGQTTEYPIIGDILSVLARRPAKDEKAGPAFVVEGVGKVALHNAQAVFKKEKRQIGEMPANKDLSLVFYSHNSGQWVHLVSVGRSENVIKVKYRFVAHITANNTNHFALIPIGKFTPGVVEIEIEQQKAISQAGMERATIPELERLVSHSFSFEVGR